MDSNDSLQNLKLIHEQFLECSYFSAISIMTPRKDWLCIDRNDANIGKVHNSAKEKKIFNLVVIEGQHVSGYINLRHIRKKGEQFHIDWDKMEKVKAHSVRENLPLFEFLQIMVNDAGKVRRRMSPLYFVLPTEGKIEEPIGIVSFWDLNRAPSYILSYPILVYLEHTLILKIKESHKNWVNHGDLLRQIRSKFKVNSHAYDHLEKFLKGPDYEYSLLSKFGFTELAYLYENDPHIERDGDEVLRKLIELLRGNRKFRNIIAHSVNLIVDGQHFRKNLEELEKIWDYGQTAFCNFIDPKLSYSPPLIND